MNQGRVRRVWTQCREGGGTERMNQSRTTKVKTEGRHEEFPCHCGRSHVVSSILPGPKSKSKVQTTNHRRDHSSYKSTLIVLAVRHRIGFSLNKPRGTFFGHSPTTSSTSRSTVVPVRERERRVTRTGGMKADTSPSRLPFHTRPSLTGRKFPERTSGAGR